MPPLKMTRVIRSAATPLKTTRGLKCRIPLVAASLKVKVAPEPHLGQGEGGEGEARICFCTSDSSAGSLRQGETTSREGPKNRA